MEFHWPKTRQSTIDTSDKEECKSYVLGTLAFCALIIAAMFSGLLNLFVDTCRYVWYHLKNLFKKKEK